MLIRRSPYCRLRPVAASEVGGAGGADLAVLVRALLITDLQKTRRLTRLATPVQLWRADLEALEVFVVALCECCCCWQSAGQPSRRWLQARLRRLILEAAPCSFSHACCAQAPAHGKHHVTHKRHSQYGRTCELAQLTHRWLRDLAHGALGLPECRYPVSVQLWHCRCNTQ